MDTIADRINMVLDSKGLRKTDLATMLGVTSSAVSQYCTGKSKPSNQTIALLSEKLEINSDWLRTGIGEMSDSPSREEEIGNMMAEVFDEDDPFKKQLHKIITDMTPEQLDALKEVALKLAYSHIYKE